MDNTTQDSIKSSLHKEDPYFSNFLQNIWNSDESRGWDFFDKEGKQAE